MPTSATDPSGAETLLVFVDESGALGRWLLLDGSGVVDGRVEDGLPMLGPGAARVLAVPGTQVAIHWLELAGGLTPPQAAAAARLMLADAAPDPIGDMHVAVGRPESGRTPVALVAAPLMARWLEGPDAPDRIVPAPLLLAAPTAGFARRDHGSLADYRAEAAAFTLEPELAAALVGDAPVEQVADAGFAAALPAILAAPPLDLRQGAFAKRRQWTIERASLRRIAALALALALLTLLVQVVTLMRYAFAADRAEAEAAALATGGGGGAADPRLGFGPVASVLFEAIRSTPNVELARIDYRLDGRLVATVLLDHETTLPALIARIEAGGLAGEAGEVRSAGGRPTADVTVRPR